MNKRQRKKRGKKIRAYLEALSADGRIFTPLERVTTFYDDLPGFPPDRNTFTFDEVMRLVGARA